MFKMNWKYLISFVVGLIVYQSLKYSSLTVQLRFITAVIVFFIVCFVYLFIRLK